MLNVGILMSLLLYYRVNRYRIPTVHTKFENLTSDQSRSFSDRLTPQLPDATSKCNKRTTKTYSPSYLVEVDGEEPQHLSLHWACCAYPEGNI